MKMSDDESEIDDAEAIIIDTGSYVTKAGWNNNDLPNVMFPTVIGRTQSYNFGVKVGLGQKGIIIYIIYIYVSHFLY